jgi:2-hydroxy-3-oxopropionate reductase
MSRASKISVLGTGIMGYPIARRLCQAGFSVTVWNRTPEKAEGLKACGARIAPSPQIAVANAPVIIAVLANKLASEQVYFEQGAVKAMGPDSLLIDMATMVPDDAVQLADVVTDLGKRFVEAPVSGGETGARDGTLSIMAGGAVSDIAEARPILTHLGRVTHVGGTGSGAVAKLCNQMIVGNTVVAVAEALNLARSMGADPAAVRHALQGGFADSAILREHGQRMLDGNFTPGGPAKYLLDIMFSAEDIAGKCGARLPLGKVTRRLFDDMIAAGRGDQDISGVIAELVQPASG